MRTIDYPTTKDAIAMVSKLEYEDKYDKAVRYIFGRTLICRNLEVATQLARTTGLDCVTLDGDQVSSKGSLTGGYFNKSRSRLEIQKTRTEKAEEIQSQNEEMTNLRSKLIEIQAEISAHPKCSRDSVEYKSVCVLEEAYVCDPCSFPCLCGVRLELLKNRRGSCRLVVAVGSFVRVASLPVFYVLTGLVVIYVLCNNSMTCLFALLFIGVVFVSPSSIYLLSIPPSP